MYKRRCARRTTDNKSRLEACFGSGSDIRTSPRKQPPQAPIGIDVIDGIIPDIRIQVDIATTKADWILANEPLQPRMIIPRAVVIQPRTVVFSTGKLPSIRRCRAGDGRLAERIIGVLRHQRPGTVGKRHGRAEPIGQEGPGASRIGAEERLVNTEAGEQIGRGGRTAEFLHEGEPIVQEVRRRAVDGLKEKSLKPQRPLFLRRPSDAINRFLFPASDGVVLETCSETGASRA